MARNRSKWLYLFLLTGIYFAIQRCIDGCGTSTHIHIAHEGLNSFRYAIANRTDYSEIIKKHRDAFTAGNPYPDAMYPTLCFSGKYHSIAEDTHWVPFLNASVNYIRKTYPRPWDQETEKLVAFVFGFVSHQVADVNWHSLGIDQGFLRTMGYMNFHSSYDLAHTAGDVGGDMISQLEGDDSPIPTNKWYVPSKDLEKIYGDYYGMKRVSREVIEDCSLLLYIEWLAEKLAGAKLSPIYEKKSPFLVEQLHSYFLGGIHDMAAWTTMLWNTTALMFEKGTEDCTLPKNPLFVSCKGRKPAYFDTSYRKVNYQRKKMLFFGGLTVKDAQVTKTERGTYFKPSLHLQNLLQLEKEAEKTAVDRILSSTTNISGTFGSIMKTLAFTTRNPYSELGSVSVAWTVSAKNDFIAFGAPHAGLPGDPSIGKVFIIRKSSLVPQQIQDPVQYVEDVAHKIIVGSEKMSRFGTAMTVLDFNQDGIDDLVVSAPSTGAQSLMYSGAIHIYFGSDNHINDIPDVTIQGTKRYTNMGYQLNINDLNGDGYNDLMVGAPFAGGGGQQRGVVFIYHSKRGIPSNTMLTEESADLTLQGKYDYQWFGYSLASTIIDGLHLTMVGAPGTRICANASCVFDKEDIQEVGKVYIYANHKGAKPQILAEINGTAEFSKLGFSLSVGDPYGTGEKSILAVGAPSGDAKGKAAFFPISYIQGGNVFLYDLKALLHASDSVQPWNHLYIAMFSGDRNFGKFGWNVEFSKFASPEYDDLFIGHPFRSVDATGELFGGEEGAFYCFQGGPTFSRGDVTSDCGELAMSPCPMHKATFYVIGSEPRARLGSSLSILAREGSSIFAGATRSSTGSFHGGIVLTFDRQSTRH